MRYNATIRWIDNGKIQDVVMKIGEVGWDDDDIFFYLEDEKEIEEFKKEGSHEWVLININKES
tara:strand:+ start:220 stop:408 length:189 start_codon:yes stop_codon:yes gene_type:complete